MHCKCAGMNDLTTVSTKIAQVGIYEWSMHCNCMSDTDAMDRGGLRAYGATHRALRTLRYIIGRCLQPRRNVQLDTCEISL